MSALTASDTMMKIATNETMAAGLVLPPVEWINFMFTLSTGKAENLDKTGQQWRKASKQVEQTIEDLHQAIDSVSAHDWTAAGRQAFEQKVDELCSQLEVNKTFLEVVGITLTAFAYALFVYAIFAVGMGTFLAGLATAAAAALAGIVTAEFYLECLAIAGTCVTVSLVATAILAGAAQMAAAVFQGGAMLAATMEYSRGDEQALSNFKQAEIDGSKTALANLAQNGINAGLAYATSKGGKGGKMGLGSDKRLAKMGLSTDKGKGGPPFSNIDIDADEDSKGTWTYGGGLKYTTGGGAPGVGGEHTLGGHVKVDKDGDVVGADGSYNYKNNATGLSGGGQLGWDGQTGKWTGKGNFGYENPTTHTGGKAEVGGEYNYRNGGWKVDGSGELTQHGGSVYKHGEGIEYDGNGTYSHNSSTNSWVGDEKNKEKI